MTLPDLMIAFAIAVMGGIIWQNAGYRDRAIVLAKQHCERVDVQLLDDTIALTKIRLKRDDRGNIALNRHYEFEFTATGNRRYQGKMTLFGNRINSIELEAHRVH